MWLRPTVFIRQNRLVWIESVAIGMYRTMIFVSSAATMILCIAFLMHPQISGAPGRNLVLEEVLKEVTSHKDVWVATGSEVAEYWRKAHPRKED